MLDIPKQVLAAQQRIKTLIRETPLTDAQALSQTIGAHVYLKCENLQYTGSFKVRGALNKLLTLSASQRAQGVVTASSGNHGAAVAYGCAQLKIPCQVFVPEYAAVAKIANIRRYGAQLDFYGTDCMQTELYARDYARTQDKIYIPPYNDVDVIAGQGTIGIELMQQLDKIDAVLVPIGGGGLIAGIAGYLKSVSPHIHIIGCLPKNSPVMAESMRAGKIIDMDTQPTLSDATAGGIEPDAITFSMCQQFVDDMLLVSEAQIENALMLLKQTQAINAEGAAGVALGALINHPQNFQHKNVVVVLSGGNTDRVF